MAGSMRRRITIALVAALVAAGGYGALRIQRAQASLEAALLETVRTVDVQGDRIAALERRLAVLRGARDGAYPAIGGVGAGPGVGVASAAPPGSPLQPAGLTAEVALRQGEQFEEAIAGRVEMKLRDRIDALASRQRARNDRGEWEPPIAELVDELGLDDSQAQAATVIFEQAHDDALELLTTAYPDGSSLLDDFAADLKSGTPPGRARDSFVDRLLVEQVPGTNRAFVSEFALMRKGVMDSLSAELDEEQMSELKSLRINPMNVKTDSDPIRDYIRAKVTE